MFVEESITIHAPADVIWNLLIDTSTWPSWNSFIPEAALVDNQENTPSGPALLTVGARRRFYALIYGYKFPTVQRVTMLERPESNSEGEKKIYRVAWVLDGVPGLLLRTLRSSEIEMVKEAGSDGPECIYRTSEQQWGPFAYATRFTVGGQVAKGIRQWCEDLKVAAEKEVAKKKKSGPTST